MACTPSATSTRYGPQATSTHHSFESSVPTTVLLAASQTSSLETSCVSRSTVTVTAESSTTGEPRTTSSGTAWWDGFRNARQQHADEDQTVTATATGPAVVTPTATAVKRAADDGGSCAAWTTVTKYFNAPAETRTTSINIQTWTWDTFETQVPLETLFAKCPSAAEKSPSPAAVKQQESITTTALSQTTPNEARPSSSSTQVSATSAASVAAAAAVAPSSSSSKVSSSSSSILAQQYSVSHTVQAESALSSATRSPASGVGAIDKTAQAPETKTLSNGNGNRDSPASDDDSGKDAGAIAGGVFGALAGLALLLLAYRWWMQRKREAKRARNTWCEKSFDMADDTRSNETLGSRFSTSTIRPTIGSRFHDARHMAQNSLSGPFPPFLNTLRQSVIAPFGGSGFKLTPLHPVESHPVPPMPVLVDDGPSLPVPPAASYIGSSAHYPSPLRTTISPPQPFIGDTYAAASDEMHDRSYGATTHGVPHISVQEPSSRGTFFNHDPSIVNSFPLPPEQQGAQLAANDRGASVYSTPSFYGNHASGQFEYSEYQNSARESLATQNTGDRTTKAWYDKELWDGGGVREGVQSTANESLYGGIGTLEAGNRNVPPGFAL